MAGRPKIPTALKELTGNPGRRPLSADEPAPAIVSIPPRAPRSLGDLGQRKWRELMPRLIYAGVLTDLGLFAIERYCTWFERRQKALENLAESHDVLSSGKGGRYVNPDLTIVQMAENEMYRLEREFGMLPASASKVKAVNPKQSDLFGDFLNRSAADPPEKGMLPN